uniref:Uncharacterized protein n=1 Tax=Timema genevievae TaxID=629358 RepID=A0A7R9K2E2_TIMGE|nr:unnamed protein product [Timema genevievae]
MADRKVRDLACETRFTVRRGDEEETQQSQQRELRSSYQEGITCHDICNNVFVSSFKSFVRGMQSYKLLSRCLVLNVVVYEVTCGLIDSESNGSGSGSGSGSSSGSTNQQQNGNDFLVGLVNALIRLHVNALNNVNILSPLLGCVGGLTKFTDKRNGPVVRQNA